MGFIARKKCKWNLIAIFFQDILYRQSNILQILRENADFIAIRSGFLGPSDVGLNLVLRCKATTTHGVFGAHKNLSTTSITTDDKQNVSEIFGSAASLRKLNQDSGGSENLLLKKKTNEMAFVGDDAE